MKTLEVIAHNLDDIRAINKSSANRIELCVDMDHDGLTPSFELVKASLALTNIPIMVMIRNHYQNFVYDQVQFQEMLLQIEKYQQLPIKGIVVGCLTTNNEIDIDQMQAIKKAANNLEITFHRAFDQVPDKIKGAQILHKMGINRVMTIGNPHQKIVDNIELLKAISEHIDLLAGGGINQDNIKTLSDAGLVHFHIGTAVRQNRSWSGAIITNKINPLWI